MPRAKRELTAKQKEFALLVAMGSSKQAAYTAAYDADNMSYGAIATAAYELSKNPEIISFLAKLQESALKATEYTLEKHIRELDDLATKAESAGNYGAAKDCRVHIGKAMGLYTDKVSIDRGELAPDALLLQLETINPALAATLRQTMGIDDTKH